VNEEEQLEIAQENARRNFEQITSRIPPRLAQKEEALLEKFSKRRGNPLTKLRALYEFMDELYAFINQFTPCKKGCDFCCKYEVSISELEARYIEDVAKIKRLKSLLPKLDFHGTPCPFLKGGACSIYKCRPFVCRRYVSLCQTPTWCHPDRSNTAKFALPRFSEVDKSFELIRQESGFTERADIRQVFGSAT
jgi:Fe-S-cluster containining protein